MGEPAPVPDTFDGYCLAEDVIHALARGVLEEDERSEALAHLDDCELCQALLADEVRALPQSPSAEDAGLPTLIQIDALVAGRYRIKRFLARGGMGEVYEAWDVLLGERVALKTINPLSATADQQKASARFKQEVQLSRRVADAHVCRIYEFGQHQVRGFGTLSYLTMEFIEGQTLGARLRHGPPLSMAEVVVLSRQMLRALGAAHAVGVLHRDFKSDNVMLRAEAHQHEVLDAVIMDFGLARLLGDQAHRLTERHEFVGSAAYMAPEQLEEGAPLSEATDIYAFGVVLFEMLTGHLPFEGNSAVAVALRRLSHTAPPPSIHVPELEGAWDDLVLRCLERDVTRRFASTEEVAAAFEGLANTAPLPRVLQLGDRRRWVSAFFVALAVLGGGASYAAWVERGGLAEEAATEAAPPLPTVTLALQPQTTAGELAPVHGVAPAEGAVTPVAAVGAPGEGSAAPEREPAVGVIEPVSPIDPATVEPAVVDPAVAAPAVTVPAAVAPVAPVAPSTPPAQSTARPRAHARATKPPVEASAPPAGAPSSAPPSPAQPAAPALSRPAATSDDVRDLFFLEPPSERAGNAD